MSALWLLMDPAHYALFVKATFPRFGYGSALCLGLVVLALILLLSGALPGAGAALLASRTVPVLGFVVAITLVAELASEAGVFQVIAQRLAVLGRGRTIALWALVILLAVVSTVFLSLDTTAVIVTPVVVLLAVSVGASPLPFALVTIYLANTGSLLLPVSNLTNLLATPTFGGHTFSFVALSWAPALVGVLVPVLVLTVANRKSLFRGYVVPSAAPVADPVLFWCSSAVLLVLLPLLVVVAQVWIPATAAAVLLLLLFAIRSRDSLNMSLIPWRALGIAAALFVIVETAHARGLTEWLTVLTAPGRTPLQLLELAGTGAISANAINNLPAYLVLEPAAQGDTVRLMALLIGVNLGPLVTPWASLATLLWHDRVSTAGVTIPWGRFMLWGLGVAILTVATATLALILISG